MSSPPTSVEHMINTLRARRARVPSEVGAYLVLEACEKLRGRPTIVSAEQVRVGDGGEVALAEGSLSCDEKQAAASLCRLLSFLLVASEDNISPGLLEILEVDPAAWTLDRLRDALEANLIPLNRQASRRVLSRLVRESQRPGPQASAARDIDGGNLGLHHLGDSAASIDAFLDGEEVVQSAPAEDLREPDDDLDLDLPTIELADLDLPDLDLDLPEAVEMTPRAESEFHEVRGQQSEVAPTELQPTSIFSQRESDLSGLTDMDETRAVWPWIAAAIALLAGLVAASALI